MTEKISLDDLSAGGLIGRDNLLQSKFWGIFKECFGWSASAFRFRNTPILVLSRKIAPGFSIAYIPFGPDIPSHENAGEIISDNGSELLSELAADLRPMLSGTTVFIRFDPPWGLEGADTAPPSLGRPLQKAPLDIQPPSTVLVSLKESEQEIFARMKPKTRYNIRLAEKKGVAVIRRGIEFLDSWYALYHETAQRDRIAIHDIKYYKTLLRLAERKEEGTPEIFFLSAEVDGKILAGNIVCLHELQGTYLYGASSNCGRNLMPAYALQWEAVKYLKNRGALWYDLFGIPSRDDPDHPMHGLYRFKTGFGGTILHRPGAYDFAYRRIFYTGYRAAESLRKFYFKKVKKRGD